MFAWWNIIEICLLWHTTGDTWIRVRRCARVFVAAGLAWCSFFFLNRMKMNDYYYRGEGNDSNWSMVIANNKMWELYGNDVSTLCVFPLRIHAKNNRLYTCIAASIRWYLMTAKELFLHASFRKRKAKSQRASFFLFIGTSFSCKLYLFDAWRIRLARRDATFVQQLHYGSTDKHGQDTVFVSILRDWVDSCVRCVYSRVRRSSNRANSADICLRWDELIQFFFVLYIYVTSLIMIILREYQ